MDGFKWLFDADMLHGDIWHWFCHFKRLLVISFSRDGKKEFTQMVAPSTLTTVSCLHLSQHFLSTICAFFLPVTSFCAFVLVQLQTVQFEGTPWIVQLLHKGQRQNVLTDRLELGRLLPLSILISHSMVLLSLWKCFFQIQRTLSGRTLVCRVLPSQGQWVNCLISTRMLLHGNNNLFFFFLPLLYSLSVAKCVPFVISALYKDKSLSRCSGLFTCQHLDVTLCTISNVLLH